MTEYLVGRDKWNSPLIHVWMFPVEDCSLTWQKEINDQNWICVFSHPFSLKESVDFIQVTTFLSKIFWED